MSRIGNRKLVIPEGVSVNVQDTLVTVTGPKGTLSNNFNPIIEVRVEEGHVLTIAKSESKEANILVGTTNSLIANMIEGVNTGFSKGLEITGVGYRFQVNGNKINVNAGFSHPMVVEVPSDLKVELVSNTEITISGIDKQKVSEFAANIRKIRQPEPYKGKGIHYKGEHIRRKEGKKAAK